MSKDYCEVCKGKFIKESRKCSNCGYLNSDILDFEEKHKIINDYKQKLIDQLNSFNVIIKHNKWNKKTEKFDAQEEKLFSNDLTYSELFNKIVWSDKEKALAHIDTSEKLKVKVYYNFGENQKNISIEFEPIKLDDFWQLGLKIDDNFNLIGFLGNADNNNESNYVKLKMV